MLLSSIATLVSLELEQSLSTSLFDITIFCSHLIGGAWAIRLLFMFYIYLKLQSTSEQSPLGMAVRERENSVSTLLNVVETWMAKGEKKNA